MSLAIDGLISGLNTTELIKSLIAVDAIPQTLLKNKVTASQTFISSLQGLNTKVASLAELTTKTADRAAFDLYSTKSGSETVTATVGAGATAGGIEFVVGQLAQTQQTVSGEMTQWLDNPPVLTIVGKDGTNTEITAASQSIDDVVSAVNKADAGVSATKIEVGPGSYRVQFTATESGAAGGFDIYRGDTADAGMTENLLTAAGAVTVRAAQDASVTLWAGTTVAETVTSATNTFDGLLTGVSFTVSEVSTKPVTVTVTRDEEKIGAVAKDLVTSLSEVLAYVDTRSTVSSSTNASGAVVAKGGVFTGDSTVRDARQKLLSAASLPIDGRSPSEIGLTITKTGTIEYDAEKFAAAHAADPAGTEAMLGTIAARIAEAADGISDKYDGTLTSKITGQESTVRSLSDQVLDWDRRLESRRSTLERTYAALEVALSSLNSQSSWLSGQLSSLPTGSN